MSKFNPALADLGEMEDLDPEISKDFEDILRERNLNDPSPSPKSSLILTIQQELGSLKKQLNQINYKIQKNNEIISSKQQENYEMKKIIGIYNEKKDDLYSSSTSCSCMQNCLIY
ncbi:hypothetical protein SteCoe_34471 [Stentor coeruleus]|uniref:Uncharacterized protein n=1 Tax=Stentor coeruleus TaxID=5963 RepID=A0A1R2AUE6_9CILI|nr:hypothetical protein SteCoe_34471 [Stentor coeruleus]